MTERRRVMGAAGGALGLSGLAAALGLCCSVPWAVALLGVTGAIAFARLTFLLPYALIAAVMLLAAGFWWAYVPVAACTAGACTPPTRRVLRRIVWVSTVIVGALSFVALSVGCAKVADAEPAYIILDDSATQLREDFNRAKGSVRLLIVVDPICPGCLRGLDDVDDSLLSKTRDPRLQTFVVHVPYLGAKAKDVAPATKLLHNGNVRHYWNESGAFGGLLSNAVNLSDGAKKWVYAWDVWLIYGPEATWDRAAPPQPKLLMHQLWALQGTTRYPKFDSEVFAKEVHALLKERS